MQSLVGNGLSVQSLLGNGLSVQSLPGNGLSVQEAISIKVALVATTGSSLHFCGH